VAFFFIHRDVMYIGLQEHTTDECLWMIGQDFVSDANSRRFRRIRISYIRVGNAVEHMDVRERRISINEGIRVLWNSKNSVATS